MVHMQSQITREKIICQDSRLGAAEPGMGKMQFTVIGQAHAYPRIRNDEV